MRALPRLALPLVALAALLAPAAPAAEAKRLKVLFLGDKGHHKPADRHRDVQAAFAARGVDLTYTEAAAALSPKVLGAYDGLLIYANIEKITPAQEKALLDYVAGGKGLIAVHCASYCFLNSPKYVELVGAQFKRHGTGVFRTTVAQPDHPVMKGLSDFESWDETYVHHKHNDAGRTVLARRVDKDGKEPWTWVRTHGKGRVFYTAWGHDARTWRHPGFQRLLERGLRWAVGADPSVVPPYYDKPAMTEPRKDVKPFGYVEAKVPFYPPGEKWGTIGKPITKMQLPLTPEESVKHMVTPVDFEVRLFAAEPDLGGKPICMGWDERGRLWVGVTVDYPNELKPAGKGRDKIVVCEDTDGDGKADKFTTFADKLSIPTSFAFYNGGIVVQQAPQTLFLKDADGDGKADVREALFAGWSTRDTHAGPSNLHWGFDNWLYGIVGYSGFRGTVGGERHSFGQGFYRFKPDGSKLEFLRSTNNNSWGVGFSEEGHVFGSTANNYPSVYLGVPNRYYESVRGWSSSALPGIAVSAKIEPITSKVRQVDHHGKFTAAAGHALYTARTYPRMYWNRTAFVAEPTGHLLATLTLEPDGAGFVARNSWNMLASDDEWTSPVMAEVGPDGHLWVIDWYNYIVQHNPTPVGFKTGRGGAYETELRDKKHGRIYRLVYTKAKPAKATTLKDATPDKLVAALRHDNLLWRRHAQRLLVERGQRDVVPALVKAAGDAAVDEVGLNAGVIHALWALHGLGALDGKDAKATAAAAGALAHKSAGVRRNALAVLPRDAKAVKAVLDGKLLADPDAQVRLAALLALAEMPSSPEAGAAVAAALAKPENLDDRWLLDAATSAAAAHDVHFLKALAARKGAPDATLRRVVAVVAEHYGRGAPGASVAGLLASLDKADPKYSEIVVRGLARGWPKGKAPELSADAEKAMAGLLAKLPAGGQGALLTLAGAWGSKAFEKHAAAVVKSLLATVGDAERGDAERAAAARQLVEFRPDDEKVAAELLKALTPRTPPALATGLLEALGGSKAAVGPALVEAVGGLAPAARAVGVQVLLSRPASTKALLDGVDKGKVRWTDLTLDQRQALLAHPDKGVAARAKKMLAKGGGLPSADRQKVLDGLMPLLKKAGNAGLGKEVYKKHCAACHVHHGEGTAIGPDLTGMAAHPKAELLTAVIDPSRSVEGNYTVYTVLTEGGRVYTGLLASETKTAVEVVEATGKKRVVLRENISSFTRSTKSLMPDGFEGLMSQDELVNLLEFLTQRGKFLPLPLDKAATAVSTRGMFYSEDAAAERLVFKDWKPKTFKGVPFHLVDPRGGKANNVVLLHSKNGKLPPKMPKSVSLPCNGPAKAIHLLSGVSGWGYTYSPKGTVSMTVRLHYEDGKTEDHALKNGEHFADYIRRVDVPGSTFAYKMEGGQQIRYLSITPARAASIQKIELVKGSDATAPVVMAVTVESP